MDNTKRIDWIDVAKGVGIFLMVMGHTSMPDAVNRWIYSFHMPLFFLLSGLVFNPDKYHNGGGYLLQKVKTLLVPYVFFAVSSNLIAAAFQTEWLHKYIWADWSLVICNGSHLAVWFLYVLFMVEVLSLFLIKLLKNRGLVLLLLVVLAVGSYIMYLNDIHQPYKLEAVGYSSLFFGIGYAFRYYYDSVEKWLLKLPRLYLFVALGVMFMVDVPISYILKPMLDIGYNDLGVHVFTFLLALWGIVMVALFSFMLNSGFIKNVFKYLGKNTMVSSHPRNVLHVRE